MFSIFKKKDKPPVVVKAASDPQISPFEILLPQEKIVPENQDLKMGSRLIDLLRSNGSETQTLEVDEKNRAITSNNPELKKFITMVVGAKQMPALTNQVEIMSFPAENESSIGALCCLINGNLNKFHVYRTSSQEIVKWKFTRMAC